MTAFEWPIFALGGVLGIVIGIAYFGGLALGMRRALRGGLAVPTLAVSAALRMGLLLGVGWAVLVNAGPWGVAGYGAAFFMCRSVAVAIAKMPLRAGGPK